MALAIALSTALVACEEASEIGSSLVEDESEVVKYSDFTVSGRTVDNGSASTRNLVQLLGRINAQGYGQLDAEFVTQLMPSSQLASDITTSNVDSVKLQLYVGLGDYVGDSIVPMGLEVYRLNRQLPANISSNFNPQAYYSPSDLIATKIYACNAIGANDSIKSLKYRMIDVKLDDAAAATLSSDLINLYKQNPDAYLFPSQFCKEFPGIYVRNSYGNGRIVEISQTLLTFYYHTTDVDSEGQELIKRRQGSFFAVTPEIIVNNMLTFQMASALEQSITQGENILVAPIGKDVEITFPINDIIDYYRSNSGSLAVVNNLSFKIPATEIENNYGIAPPENLLLVLTSQKDAFFKNNNLADNISSFYASYNATSGCYNFSGMRNYLLNMLKKETITADDYTFTLTPVTVVSETNTSNSYYGTTTEYVSSIDPYIGVPSMVKLNLDESEISLTFSKQTMN